MFEFVLNYESFILSETNVNFFSQVAKIVLDIALLWGGCLFLLFLVSAFSFMLYEYIKEKLTNV